LIVLFLAVTSATAAELIAVSSVLTYDVYKKYINPNATEAQIMKVSHWMVALFALVMGLAGMIFFFIGVSMGWLYTFMGVILGSAVVPIALCITWKKANKWGCMTGAIVGFFLGIMTWLVTTATLNDNVINVTTTGSDFEMLSGNIVSICVGGIIAVVSSYIWPENFDFDITRAVNSPVDLTPVKEPKSVEGEYDEKKGGSDSASEREVQVIPLGVTGKDELDPVALEKAFRFAAWSSVVLLLIFIIIIPLPLFFAQTIYGAKGLAAWVSIGIAWAFGSAFTVVIYPLWESRTALLMVGKGVIKDIFAKGSGRYVGPELGVETKA